MMRAIAVAVAAVLLLAGCTPPRVAPAPMQSHDVRIQLFQWPWTSIVAECSDELGPAGIAWVSRARRTSTSPVASGGRATSR